MTRDEIIKIAKQCGHWSGQTVEMNDVGLEHFAALVAAAEREDIAAMIEDAPNLVEFAVNKQGGCLVCGFTPKFAAATIRARGAA